MLGNAPFYHSLTKKSVILFGRLFDDITVVRTSNTTGKETQRFLVPIVYAPKEKMITRIESDPNLLRQVQSILPRMSFEITGLSYDATRKQNSLLRSVATNNSASTVKSQYVGVPYDITFALNVYARNIDDGTHIVEQILPFFNPDFTVTAAMVPDMGFLKDIPIVLNSVSNDIQYEGNFDSVRYVYWTLTFTMKTYFYGPITTPKVITSANTRIFNDNTIMTNAGYLASMIVSNANGKFAVGDSVYQGNNRLTSNTYGKVVYYNANTRSLVVNVTEGRFIQSARVHAEGSNAVCTISSYKYPEEPSAFVKSVPNPITSKPGDDYGYYSTITYLSTSTEIPGGTVTVSYPIDSTTSSIDDMIITIDTE